MQWAIVMLSAYLILIIAAMLCVVHYKNSRNRKDKRQLVLVAKWETYMESIMGFEPLADVKMNERIRRKLRSTEKLMAFSIASKTYISARNPEMKRNFQRFIYENKTVWVELGSSYHSVSRFSV